MPANIALLPWLSPTFWLSGAVLATLLPARRWQVLALANRAACAAALVTAAAALGGGDPAYGATNALAAPLVGLLIAFLGWIIGDYSRNYLCGEPGQTRFVTAFLATLAAVGSVVAARSLLGVILGWIASSAGLHHLLTYYRDRGAALVVAHKKFLVSRLAEVCLAAAALLLHHRFGTLDLGALGAAIPAGAAPGADVRLAAALIAIAVLLKCAQLPLHGWLIQVMEAPTPVSALLHAGVVNLGGYVLVRLAPLISAAPGARALLVVVGGLSAALAGLVMLTRITIKVRLAWSTCSQMGLMVMECGLGLYDLALLHLLAHALYKAHAFLTAGDAVRDGVARRLSAASPRAATTTRPLFALVALLAGLGLTLASAALWRALLPLPGPSWLALALPAFGVATLCGARAYGHRAWWRNLLTAALVTQLYFGWHWLLDVPLRIQVYPCPAPLAIWTVLLFAALYLTQEFILAHPTDRRLDRLYEWVYAGFYLDERFTRLAFRLWPVRAVPAAPPMPGASFTRSRRLA
ncbi:MAG: NADH-quinone oxidoreductase subunit L [Gammaproteobacteria bacterium]|nr:NADH-quinone oxidoreductase subunit L [Gammaproteobacteria bacterium]